MKFFLLIGGNLGNRQELIVESKLLISNKIGEIVQESSLYESEPWGFKSEQNFLNQVIVVESEKEVIDVLEQCQQIENALGRVRHNSGYASRTMDIDILFIDDKIINTERLTVPHEHLHKRNFTLLPLNELDTDFKHPVLNKTIKQLLLDCDDNSIVNKI